MIPYKEEMEKVGRLSPNTLGRIESVSIINN